MAKPGIFWIGFWCTTILTLGILMVVAGFTVPAFVFGLSAGHLLGMIQWRMTLREIWDEQHGRKT